MKAGGSGMDAAGKPERMTCLSGTRMVPKTCGRIAFRGLIDTLEAETIEAQVLASGLGEADYCARLGEVLEYLRAVMAAEVKETPLPPPFLFGFEADELRRRIHGGEGNSGPANRAAVPVPSYTQGPLAARINSLRAKTREAELLAVRVFSPGEEPPGAPNGTRANEPPAEREDIILALNRLSGALWWLFCEYLRDKAGR